MIRICSSIIPQLEDMIESEITRLDARCSAQLDRVPARRLRRGRASVALLVCAVAALSTACVYRLPIRQGNYLDPASIAQVKPGMTHSQVRYLLGTPMVPEGFDNGRWDYD